MTLQVVVHKSSGMSRIPQNLKFWIPEGLLPISVERLFVMVTLFLFVVLSSSLTRTPSHLIPYQDMPMLIYFCIQSPKVIILELFLSYFILLYKINLFCIIDLFQETSLLECIVLHWTCFSMEGLVVNHQLFSYSQKTSMRILCSQQFLISCK